MRFPRKRVPARRRLRAPMLCGGLDVARGAGEIGDDQLSECANFFWRRGALRTRPGLATSFEEAADGAAADRARYFRTGDGLRIYVFCAPEIRVLGRDGTLLEQHTLPGLEDGIDGFFAETGDAAPDGSGGAGVLLFASNGMIFRGARGGAFARADGLVYEPLVLVNGRAAGYNQVGTDGSGGDLFEGFNLLTRAYRARYTSDGGGGSFYLPVRGLDRYDGMSAAYTTASGAVRRWHFGAGSQVTQGVARSLETQTVDGADVWCFVELAAGRVYWSTGGSAALLPEAGIANNVELRAFLPGEGREGEVGGMSAAVWFGGDAGGLGGGTRLFVAGDPRHPNLVRWSDVNRPLYFPENNFVYVGGGDQRVTGFGKQGELLIIFKERELYAAGYAAGQYTAEELMSGGVVDAAAASAVFPVRQLDATVGCDAPGTICLYGGRLLWASAAGAGGEPGVYTLSAANPFGGRNVQRLSGAVTPLLRGGAWQNACGTVWEGCYLLLLGGEVFVLGLDAGEDKGAWYRWELRLRFEDGGYPYRSGDIRWQRVFACGEDCFFIGLGLAAWVWRLGGEADTDAFLPGGGTLTAVPKPVGARLCTKRFDLGDALRDKAVTGIQLGLAASEDARVRVGCVSDAGAGTERPVYGGGGMRARRVPLHLWRAASVGVTLSGEGAIALEGVGVEFRVLG